MEAITRFYEALGFEEIDFDDEPVLFSELDDDGNYAIITDEDGMMITSLEQPALFSYYTGDDEFQWSVTLEDSYFLKDIMNRHDDMDDLLQVLQEHRLDNMIY